MKPFLEAGKIVGTHGIKGELRAQSWCDSAGSFCALKTLYLDEAGQNPVSVLQARPHKNIILLILEGVDSVGKGDALRDAVLYLKREDLTLSAGQYFLQDLIGLSVIDADTKAPYGTLTDVSFTGANDVYHIHNKETNKEYLIPAIRDVVRKTDIEAGVMEITPLKGIFDED